MQGFGVIWSRALPAAVRRGMRICPVETVQTWLARGRLARASCSPSVLKGGRLAEPVPDQMARSSGEARFQAPRRSSSWVRGGRPGGRPRASLGPAMGRFWA
jgi:hypothetical protein